MSCFRRWLWLSVSAVAAIASAQAPAQPSSDVYIRLFSTRTVKALVLMPQGIGATLRRCATCKPQAMGAPASISEGAGGLRLNGEPTQHVRIDGELQLSLQETSQSKAPYKLVSAAGIWQIDSVNGELRVVLTVPRERYVMAVLTGEAAPDEPLASLEALAIVVRSYAFANAGKHRAEGYDFEDSTESQAALFGPLSPRIRDAVQATAGETLWVGRSRVPAYFSENCGGMTEDAAALWGGAKKPWLTAHADPYCQRTPARWHGELSGEELRTALVAEGWKLSGPVTAVHVLARTPGGRASRVEVVADGQKQTMTAERFRFAVGRALGWNRLRSEWYTVSFAGGKAVFEGRGYGHGVGLCQAGARAFAVDHPGDAAAVSRGILQFYFPTADVRVEAKDRGWQQREGAGWTLFSVASSSTREPAVIRVGDDAWARARTLFPVTKAPHPSVRLYPDTDLFRQSTATEGWLLGATRGQDVALQPASVVARHETLEQLLLHEFLHVLVESEAGDDAPLWLREGLVEWLAGGRDAKPGPLKTARDAAMLNLTLTQAHVWRAADAGHHAAAVLVAQLIVRYGTSAVRSWLRNGVPNGVLVR